MNYQVKINGAFVPLETARVSAIPFNRRWPGKQRQIEQSEVIDFLNFSIDEPTEIEIFPPEPVDKVEIRPKSLGIKPQITEAGTITFVLEKPAYFTIEPYGRHNALHLFADPVSNYPVDFQDENVMYYGPGEHEVGEIRLESNQTLFLDEGAVVYACIKAMDADNIRILGRGILDNSRNKEQILFEANEENNDSAVNNAVREHTVQLEYCNGIEIDGITIRDSLVYNIRPIGCRDLHISHVKIIGCWRFNSDGIDMHNCVNVLVENCFLRTFDDSICIKGFDCYYEGDVEAAVRKAMYRNGKSYDVFQNVKIRNCTIWNDWGKSLEIGAETRAEDISNIVFEDCDIIHVTGSVLDCMNVDYADVHDICFRNIRVEYDDRIPQPMIQRRDDHSYEQRDPDYAPAIINVEVLYHHEYSAGGIRRGKNHDILFDRIYLYGSQKPIFSFNGYSAEYATSNITIQNFHYNDEPLTEDDAYQWNVGDFCENIQLLKG